MGNSAIKQGVGGCENVLILVQGINMVKNVFLMELRQSEVVLRAVWIVKEIWGQLRIINLELMLNASKVTLSKDPSLGWSRPNGKMTFNALKNNKDGFMVTPLLRTAKVEVIHQFP